MFSESKPSNPRTATSEPSSKEATSTNPAPSPTPAPRATTTKPPPKPNLRLDLTVNIRHKPNSNDSVPKLRNHLHALKTNLCHIPPDQIHVWIEVNETTALYYADTVVSSLAACDAAGVHRHVIEETWNSLTVYHIRSECPTPYTLMLTTNWYLYRQLPIIALNEFLHKNPSYIYIRFAHADAEKTLPIKTPAGGEWKVDRVSPTSHEYFTEHPHLYCLPCLIKHVYSKKVPDRATAQVPDGNWPNFENNLVHYAKTRRKRPFEFGVTKDPHFIPIHHPCLGELPTFPRSAAGAAGA